MNNLKLVLRELFERKAQLAMSFLAILLGITVIVSIQTVTHFSKIAVAQELDNLGANILILPKDATIDNYYRSDFVEAFIPETYVRDILFSDLQGVTNMSPRLVIPDVKVGGKLVNLTGVLPKDEYPQRPAWMKGADIFAIPESACGPNYQANANTAENAVRRKIINHLAADQCYVGSQIAKDHALNVGSVMDVNGRKFNVVEVLPETGTLTTAGCW
jgi:putative ABC transport system permease protein